MSAEVQLPSVIEGAGNDRVILSRAFARLDPMALGIAMGTLTGVGLAAATAVLLIRGGQAVGHHLGRLAFFLPGYDVSWPGVFVGLLDAAVLGFVLGQVMARTWNAYHRWFVAYAVARETNRAIRRELQGL